MLPGIFGFGTTGGGNAVTPGGTGTAGFGGRGSDPFNAGNDGTLGISPVNLGGFGRLGIWGLSGIDAGVGFSRGTDAVFTATTSCESFEKS